MILQAGYSDMAMKILTKMLRQKAVYWPVPTSDGRGGVQVDAPVEISCRWEDVEQEYSDAAGHERLSRAVVYVDRDLVVGGFLKKCTLAELKDGGDRKLYDDVYEVMKFGTIPTLKADQFLRSAWL